MKERRSLRLNGLTISQRQWPVFSYDQNHMFYIAKLCYQMSQIYSATLKYICAKCRYDKTKYTARQLIEFAINWAHLWGWTLRLNGLKISQRHWPLFLRSKSHVRHSKTMSPDVDETKPKTLPETTLHTHTIIWLPLFLWSNMSINFVI